MKRVLALALFVPLAGCAIPFGQAGGGGPQASQETVAACNRRADEVFLRQNRDAIYKADTYDSSIRDSPYAGAGLPGPNTSQGLSDQFSRDRTVQNCVDRTIPAGTGPSGPVTPPVEDHP